MTLDPTLHYKMKGDEANDGSGEGIATPKEKKRTDVITGKRENGNRQLSTLIANIETDVQAE